MSKNKTSKFQYFVVLFIHLRYPHVFALWWSVRNCFLLTCCKNLCLSSL